MSILEQQLLITSVDIVNLAGGNLGDVMMKITFKISFNILYIVHYYDANIN